MTVFTYTLLLSIWLSTQIDYTFELLFGKTHCSFQVSLLFLAPILVGLLAGCGSFRKLVDDLAEITLRDPIQGK